MFLIHYFNIYIFTDKWKVYLTLEKSWLPISSLLHLQNIKAVAVKVLRVHNTLQNSGYFTHDYQIYEKILALECCRNLEKLHHSFSIRDM